jgi:hypothetical protein
MSPKDRAALDACYAYYIQHGQDITFAHVASGLATNAYLVARRIGKLPAWVTRGSIAHAAARAGMKHHRQDAAA